MQSEFSPQFWWVSPECCRMGTGRGQFIIPVGIVLLTALTSQPRAKEPPHPFSFAETPGSRGCLLAQCSATLSCPDPSVHPWQQHPRTIQLGKDLPEQRAQPGSIPFAASAVSSHSLDIQSWWLPHLPAPSSAWPLFHGCVGVLVFLWGWSGLLWELHNIKDLPYSLCHIKTGTPSESGVSLWAALCGLG